MEFRVRYISVGLILVVLFFAFIVSCNEVEQHNVLTFFFDGVPPLGGEELGEGPVDSNLQERAQTRPEAVWYVHGPQKDCTTCHGKRSQRWFSTQTRLTAPVPKLCYDCHTDYTVSASFVHGPVSAGQCLFCHNPHRSKIKHLLKEPEPRLCYLCHNRNMIESIPGHSTELSSVCTNCHNAHASSTRYLLKAASYQTNGELDTAKVETKKIRGQQDERKREIAELYYRSIKFYRAGQLEKAREGFIRVLESGLVPAPMAKTIGSYLLDIDSILTKRAKSPSPEP